LVYPYTGAIVGVLRYGNAGGIVNYRLIL
jgi:hypothetical protein